MELKFNTLNLNNILRTHFLANPIERGVKTDIMKITNKYGGKMVSARCKHILE